MDFVTFQCTQRNCRSMTGQRTPTNNDDCVCVCVCFKLTENVISVQDGSVSSKNHFGIQIYNILLLSVTSVETSIQFGVVNFCMFYLTFLDKLSGDYPTSVYVTMATEHKIDMLSKVHHPI